MTWSVPLKSFRTSERFEKPTTLEHLLSLAAHSWISCAFVLIASGGCLNSFSCPSNSRISVGSCLCCACRIVSAGAPRFGSAGAGGVGCDLAAGTAAAEDAGTACDCLREPRRETASSSMCSTCEWLFRAALETVCPAAAAFASGCDTLGGGGAGGSAPSPTSVRRRLVGRSIINPHQAVRLAAPSLFPNE